MTLKLLGCISLMGLSPQLVGVVVTRSVKLKQTLANLSKLWQPRANWLFLPWLPRESQSLPYFARVCFSLPEFAISYGQQHQSLPYKHSILIFCIELSMRGVNIFLGGPALLREFGPPQKMLLQKILSPPVSYEAQNCKMFAQV